MSLRCRGRGVIEGAAGFPFLLRGFSLRGISERASDVWRDWLRDVFDEHEDFVDMAVVLDFFYGYDEPVSAGGVEEPVVDLFDVPDGVAVVEDLYCEGVVGVWCFGPSEGVVFVECARDKGVLGEAGEVGDEGDVNG